MIKKIKLNWKAMQIMIEDIALTYQYHIIKHLVFRFQELLILSY
jgi:hypothetical protein